MRIAVTGAKGQLGKSLYDILSHRKDIQTTYLDIEDLDLTDFKAVSDWFSLNKFDVIINCAAFTNVDGAEAHHAEADAINGYAVGNLARISESEHIRLVHISTDYVFDGKGMTPYKETDTPAPATAYGSSKLMGERLISRFCPKSVIIRTAWLYSPYGKNFFLTMRNKALSGEKVSVVNDQRGTPTLASNLADAIVKISSADKWTPGIYNFTDEGETTWYDFAREIYSLTGADENLVSPISTAEFNASAPRPLYSVLDKTKIKEIYNIKIPDWKESLSSLISQYGTE